MTEVEIITRLIAALVLGGLVGFEREWTERPAGLRTHALVSLGSALVMVVNIYLFERFSQGTTMDVTRMAAQVVSGIGFLGAGTIIRSKNGVHGLTTAASLWVVAAIGLAAGCGFWLAAITVTVCTLVGLTMMRWIQVRIDKFRRNGNSAQKLG